MSDERALLTAICAHPEEDTPRLAYADWLDENAEAMPAKKRESVRMRAELIRVQCELARMPPEEENADGATRRVELEVREQALLKNTLRRRAWAKPLNPPPVGGEPLLYYVDDRSFWRGFPSFVFCEAETFIAAGEALFTVSPVRRIACRTIQGAVGDRFLRQPWLSRVRRLCTGSEVEPSDAASTEKVFAAQALASLEELDLRNCEFRAASEPVAIPALASLRKLDLYIGRMHYAGEFTRLGNLLPAQVRLREFNLDATRYGANELAEIVALPQFGELERLGFGTRFGNAWPAPAIGAAGVRAVTTAACWRSLQSFRDTWDKDRWGNGFNAIEAEELAAAPPTPNLRTLALTSGNLGGAVAALAASPLLASVTSLDLRNTPFGDAGAVQLAKSPHLNRLVSLNVARWNIGPKGTKALAEAPWSANLVRLNLSGFPIRKQAVDVLVAPGAFPRLRLLDLTHCAPSPTQTERLRKRFGNGLIL